MQADLLHVIAVISNPIRWQTRILHARNFIDHMKSNKVRLTVVECAFGQRPFELNGIDGIEHIGVRCETLAWNKENLINIGISRSSIKTPYIAWVDADIEFRNKNWAAETVHSLQQYAVVQPWSDALDLGPRGEPMFIKGYHVQTSLAKVWRELGKINVEQNRTEYASGWRYPHPGYAWAIQRDVLNNIGGLIEASGLGAGDHQMAMGFIGQINNAIHGLTNKVYQDTIRAWGERAWKFVQGNVGYVQGTIEHQFHGAKPKRKYEERWSILIEEDFNPHTDLRKNLDGVLELSGNKPRLRHRFDSYLRQRDEDQNSLSDD